MPRCWVKDYFKHCLVDAAEQWLDAKSKGNGDTRTDITKAVADEIEATINEQNEAVPPNLQKV